MSTRHERRIATGAGAPVSGDLTTPERPRGIVVFAHGSGSSRLSPRNRQVAEHLNHDGLATLLFDLLTPQEEGDRANVFDIPLLGTRLVATTQWIQRQPEIGRLPIGYFGASTGAAAASTRRCWSSTTRRSDGCAVPASSRWCPAPPTCSRSPARSKR